MGSLGEDLNLSTPQTSSNYQAIDKPEDVTGGNLEADRVSYRDPDRDPPRKNGKVPKKILHFSDGTLEVYSSSESDGDDDEKSQHQSGKTNNQSATSPKEIQAAINPNNLRWIPWMVHYTWWFGSGFLGYCDFLGEKLAWALGITSPKYYYEIEDAKREQEFEEERQKRLGVEAGSGWTEPKESVTTSKLVETLQPTPKTMEGQSSPRSNSSEPNPSQS